MPDIVDRLTKFLAENILFVAIANVTSVIGLILTFCVSRQVRGIRSYYVFRVRVPEHIDKLRQHSSAISRYLNAFEENLSGIEIELSKAEVTLQYLLKKLDRQSRRSARQLLKTIKSYNAATPKTQAQAREIYVQTIKLVYGLEELQKDLSWEQ
jgi:hypothetical protein